MNPISASESGKNAYYMGHCRHTEHNPAYCACLEKIRRVKAHERVDPVCADPIRLGTCQAVHMRQAEELAGEALYFVSREDWQKGMAKLPPWAVPVDQSPVTERPVPQMTEAQKRVHGGMKSSGAFGVEAAVTLGGSYADAINAAMKSSVAPISPPVSAPKPTPSPSPAPVTVASTQISLPRLPGESPIAYAKRRAAALKGEKQA
jgi:hypothetical protein